MHPIDFAAPARGLLGKAAALLVLLTLGACQPGLLANGEAVSGPAVSRLAAIRSALARTDWAALPSRLC